MFMKKELFGMTSKGESVYKYTLTNQNGMKVVISELGAAILELYVPDAAGKLDDVVLGYEEVGPYEDNGPGFGAVVGRHANRIGGASFTLNGKTYELAKNDNGKNNLHSNPNSYIRRVWKQEEVESELGESLMLTLFSPDKDQGYPGNFEVSIQYTLTEDNSLMLEYRGNCDEDTIVNMTNHSYFNLSGHASGDILNHKVWIDSDEFTEADDELIPTGRILPVVGTPMDFNTMKPIGQDIEADYEPIQFGGGYDHNYVLKTNGEIKLIAKLEDEVSGRGMEVYTDLPGVQFYTGNFLEQGDNYKGGAKYDKRHGVCFESQYYPDSIHHDNFPSPVLKAGEEYHTVTVYKFYTL
ncbi:MAG: aldose epimerase family protein [Lachnospiraceae bacterium]